MKRMKKFAGLLLALVMAFSLAVPAFAANDGKITINNAVVDQTYSIYRIFDLESYVPADPNAEGDQGAYSYKASAKWKAWLATQTNYVTLDDQGYVTWVDGADQVAFTKAALTYAKGNSIATDASQKATSTTVEFSNLPLGQYLVDSTVGALCTLTTTDPETTIQDKNLKPSVDKQVKEDSTGTWGESNDADIGQTVEFQATINLHEIAVPGTPSPMLFALAADNEGFIFHDKMSAGLTFTAVTGVALNGVEVDPDVYEVRTETLGDDCTFHVVFSKAYCDERKTTDTLVISYTAVLNENAVVGGNGNPNEAWVEYGENHDMTTTPDTTTTYTYQFDLIKTDTNNKVLDGAEFQLRDANGTTIIKLVELAKGSYRVATPTEAAAEGFVSATIETVSGKATIAGLDGGTTYKLEETKAPAGYNKLSGYVSVIIEDSNLTGIITGDTWTSGGVHVINNTGSQLPETGGIGTTLFYGIGGVLMLAAVVLLVAKKRMGADT